MEPTSIQQMDPEQTAIEWTRMITTKMLEAGVSEADIRESADILYSFTKNAMVFFRENPVLPLPYTSEKLTLTPRIVNQILDAFLRGVNYLTKQVRDLQIPKNQRIPIIEAASMDIFNMSQVLVAMRHIPHPNELAQNMATGEKEINRMIKYGVDDLMKKHVPQSMLCKPQQQHEG